MSDCSSECSFDSQNDSEYNYIANYVLEDERQTTDERQLSESEYSDQEVLYKDEPLADEEWLRDYNEKKKKKSERQEEQLKRLDGTVAVDSWCECGNCKIELLQNEKECVCCHEIDHCSTALSNELVLEDVLEQPTCITAHPGFRPICLEKWALRASAEKYRCRDRSKYKQRGSEARFLRSVAYRAFTYLVHGFQGNKRIALPACAYNAIRQKFKDQNEKFTGFEEED